MAADSPAGHQYSCNVAGTASILRGRSCMGAPLPAGLHFHLSKASEAHLQVYNGFGDSLEMCLCHVMKQAWKQHEPSCIFSELFSQHTHLVDHDMLLYMIMRHRLQFQGHHNRLTTFQSCDVLEGLCNDRCLLSVSVWP